MVENKTKATEHHELSWLDFLALGIVFFAVIISILGVLVVFSSQTQTLEAPL